MRVIKGKTKLADPGAKISRQATTTSGSSRGGPMRAAGGLPDSPDRGPPRRNQRG